MKKFFKIMGITLLSIILLSYLAFLFIVPAAINLNKYKPEIQKLVQENTKLSIDFNSIKLITSPILEAGIKADDINVKLPDNSTLFSADNIQGKIFLPSLLWRTIRVSCANIQNPTLNLEIINSEKFKAAKVYEDIINEQRAQRRLNPPKEIDEQASPIDLSKIKIIVPAVKLNNYMAVINDIKAVHKLTLKGEQIQVGYFNGKVAKLKADAEFFSDNDKNITANIDINTFLPEFTQEPKDDDYEGVFELPFINPVSTYRDYNLKSNIDSKIKVRQSRKNNKIWAKGFINIDGTTVTLDGMQLPESYLKISSKGHKSEFDTNLYVTDKEFLKIFGTVSNGKKPYLDISLKSTQVHFANLLNIAKAYLNTLHIKNDMGNITANGYLFSNFKLRTNFTDFDSEGKFIVRKGNIHDKNIGLLFNDINANISFDNNTFKISDTHALINNQPLSISGKIDSNSIANINIFAKRIPITGLYKTFAPKDIKNSYDLTSGFASIDTKITGEIKDISALIKTELEDFVFSDKTRNFVISNKLVRLGITNFNGDIKGKFTNSGFKMTIPATNSIIADDLVSAQISNDGIYVNESVLKVNKQSEILFNGTINDYLTNPDIKFSALGALADIDIKTLIGPDLAGYFDSKGAIPIKAKFEAKGKKMKAVAQAATSMNSYITPVKFDEFNGKQMLLQFFAEKNGETLKLHKTGLYIRRPNAQFVDDLRSNIINTREVIGIRAILTNLSTNPFISLFRVRIPRDLNGSICIFDKSKFTFGGQLFAFGKIHAPKINGNFYIRNLNIPEILTSIRDINTDLETRDVKVNISNVLANGSDFNINILTTWKQLAQMQIAQMTVNSNFIDADKIMQVSEALTKSMPAANTQTSANAQDIPIEILAGNINLKKIKSGNIIVDNTTGNISLYKNIFYINKLRTYPMGGFVSGDASMNLATTEINAKVSGRNFDMERVLLDAMGMKDTLSGDLSFITDIKMKGATQTEQMESLSGYLDFNVKDGQLGPFGKFENFLMAENIRENAFFSSTIGSVITNLVTIDTSHFNSLYGHLTFKGGFADVAPIKSQGNVMSMYIAGKVGLVDNSADLKLRGKLASAFSDSLGPLANINPVNLIKNTPGLNVVAAKTFSIFCETVSEDEMKALPELAEGKSDDYATKFQIVLRGDTRKPLKMIKSFKWLALNSEMEAAQEFVDAIPLPTEGEENLSVEELINLRAQQATEQATVQLNNEIQQNQEEHKSFLKKIKSKFSHNKI